MTVVTKRTMVLLCRLQLQSKMRPYTPSQEQGNDVYLKFAVETEILREKCESISSSEKETVTVREVTRDKFLRRRRMQTLSDMVGTRKWAARERCL